MADIIFGTFAALIGASVAAVAVAGAAWLVIKIWRDIKESL